MSRRHLSQSDESTRAFRLPLSERWRRIFEFFGQVVEWFSPRHVSLSVHLFLKVYGVHCHKALLRGVVEVMYYVLVGVGCGFASFLYYSSRVGVEFRGRNNKELGYPEIAGLTTMISVFGGALSFLLVFRLNWSYQHWWEARGAIGSVFAKSKSLMVMFMTDFEGCGGGKVVDRAKVVLKMYAAAVTDELSYGPDKVDETFLVSGQQQIKAEWFEANLRPRELEILGRGDARRFVETPYRVYLTHSWLSNSVNEASMIGLFENSEAMVAQQQLADLMELYHKLVKIKTTKMPGAIHFLVHMLKMSFCLVLYPQFLAYAFVMKLNDLQRTNHVIKRSDLFPAIYLIVTTLGIIYFVTMHVIAAELDDPFGDDISDFPLTKWTVRLWSDLDHIREIHKQPSVIDDDALDENDIAPPLYDSPAGLQILIKPSPKDYGDNDDLGEVLNSLKKPQFEDIV